MSMTLSCAIEGGFFVTGDDRIKTSVSSKGNQIKWRRSDGIWAKADDMGYEGLAEQTAYRLLVNSNLSCCVEYAACRIIEEDTGYLGCVSKDFLSDGEELHTIARLFESDALEFDRDMKTMPAPGRLRYLIENTERITGTSGFGGWLGMLLEFDAFILNEDRHLHNVALVRRPDGTYRPMPVFDNGAAFLSDTRRDYPLGMPIEAGIRKAKSKPVVTDFDKQLAAVDDVVGLSLKYSMSPDAFQVVCPEYSGQTVARVQSIISFQSRRYPHLFNT